MMYGENFDNCKTWLEFSTISCIYISSLVTFNMLKLTSLLNIPVAQSLSIYSHIPLFFNNFDISLSFNDNLGY